MERASKFLNEVAQWLKELSSETDKVKQSDFFRHYLDVMSKFWRYSYHNQLLILYQMPQATRVAGFRKWRELGRWVKKGSRAIRILVPRIRKIAEIDPDNGEIMEEEEVTGFFSASVFDVSQTEGQPLPDINITVNGDNYGYFLQYLIEFCNSRSIKVDFRNLGINGLYGYSKGGQIAITNTESINTQVNTIIHEIGHEILHKGKMLSRRQREIQAEGVAYVVTKHFGMENRSYNYLALYSANYKKIMENLKAIAEASREIIKYLEERLSGAVPALDTAKVAVAAIGGAG